MRKTVSGTSGDFVGGRGDLKKKVTLLDVAKRTTHKVKNTKTNGEI